RCAAFRAFDPKLLVCSRLPSTMNAICQTEVAQISNLLYRRFPIGRAWIGTASSNSGDLQAESRAIQQIGNLRYGGVSVRCACKVRRPVAHRILAAGLSSHARLRAERKRHRAGALQNAHPCKRKEWNVRIASTLRLAGTRRRFWPR